MANILTEIRILCSIALLFCPVFSPSFFMLYALAGLTDALDGAVARRTNTVSEFGSQLDTIADGIFVAVCFLKLLPSVELPMWIVLWIAVLAGIKGWNIVVGYQLQRKFVTVHSLANKGTGILLFLLPFALTRTEGTSYAVIVCAIASVAAIDEGNRIRRKKP